MSKLTEITERRELLVNLTLRELRSKYKRSFLGWAWSLLNPAAIMLIYTLVFAYFLKIAPPRGHGGLKVFALWLLCALLPWNFLANSIMGSMGALLGNANLIRKVWFPREILVAANIASWLVSFLIEMGVLSVAFLIAGNDVLPFLPLVLALIALQTAFVLGLGLMLSVLNVYFRDVQHFIGIFLQVWFYLTPIVYPVTTEARAYVPLRKWGLPVRALYDLNPMVRFSNVYRDLLYQLRLPTAADVLFVIGVTVVTVVIGFFVFQRFDPKLIEEL